MAGFWWGLFVLVFSSPLLANKQQSTVQPQLVYPLTAAAKLAVAFG